jgi:hypothetical protein
MKNIKVKVRVKENVKRFKGIIIFYVTLQG